MAEVAGRDMLETLAAAGERWRAAFEEIEHDAAELGEVLDQQLAAAASTDAHDRAGSVLREVAGKGRRALSEIQSLVAYVGALRDEWAAEHRYGEEGIAALQDQVAAALADDPGAGARSWLLALLDAADAGEETAAAAIATAPLPWPDQLRPGAERLGGAFAHWRDGGRAPKLEPVEELASRRLEGWEEVPTAYLGARAHRFAAWTALRTRGDAETAGRHIEDAVRLYPYAGRMHAERAAFHLFVGDFERATTDAQHAIEKAPQDPAGYIALGGCAELTGKFTSADDLYRRACERMPTAAIARIHGRTALVDPTGRLLKVAAAKLLEAGRPEQALALANEALLSGVRGSEAHPEANVQVIRRRALELLEDRVEAAEAAMQAGRLCIWNGDIDCALEELGRAVELDTNEQAGWLLADVFLTKSYPLGASAPDQEFVGRARSTWEGWAEKVGLPRGPSSWAYVSRAIVSDLESQAPSADRRAGLFEALLYVEKALVLNYTDAQRWGYVAQFLRYLGLEQLAFEAVEAGYRLASADRQVLAERLPLLANSRRFDDAEETAERLVAMYGEDPWVSAVRAWLALHQRRDWETALERLELPIREGNDHAWYHEMQALAYLGLGRVDDARECYRKLLKAVPVDGNTKCRLALASLALGDLSAARRWLADAHDDQTTPPTSYVMTAALEALAHDDLDGAASRVDQAIRMAGSAVEVDDLVFELMLSMSALQRDEKWVSGCRRALTEVTEKAVTDQKAQLELNPPSADSELESALAQLDEQPLDVPRTALLALAARRDATAGRSERAVERYELLRGSRFEPEAAIALEQIAARRAARAASID